MKTDSETCQTDEYGIYIEMQAVCSYSAMSKKNQYNQATEWT